jgi:hypothetical protein
VHYFFSACCVFPCSWAHVLTGCSSLQCALSLLSLLCVPLLLGSCSLRLQYTTVCNKSSQPAVCSTAPGLMFSHSSVHYSVHYIFSVCCVFTCSWAHFLTGCTSLHCALCLLSLLSVPLLLGSCSHRLQFTKVCTTSSQPAVCSPAPGQMFSQAAFNYSLHYVFSVCCVFTCSWAHVLTSCSSLQCALSLLSLLCVPLLLLLGSYSHRLQLTTVCTKSSHPAVCSPGPWLMFSQAAVH